MKKYRRLTAVPLALGVLATIAGGLLLHQVPARPDRLGQAIHVLGLMVTFLALCLFLGVNVAERRWRGAKASSPRQPPGALLAPPRGSWHIQAHMRVLAVAEGHDGTPLYSGSRALFRYREVTDGILLRLVGASQLGSGEDGSAWLAFSHPGRHQSYLREGLEFDILNRAHRPIGRGTVARILDVAGPGSPAGREKPGGEGSL